MPQTDGRSVSTQSMPRYLLWLLAVLFVCRIAANLTKPPAQTQAQTQSQAQPQSSDQNQFQYRFETNEVPAGK